MYSGIAITYDETKEFIQKHIASKYTVEDLANEETSSSKVADLLAQFKIV
ncbi:hypothetical protein KA478_01665 [Patescibacteria group bacterium]|nr:hypothetical protein [Patescibacteria group bacterium]